ncbi:MAG TPA: MFS transporter [Mycobacteriales bacterium]|nr:MFS transporter [Mycobacteriales bacterium]
MSTATVAADHGVIPAQHHGHQHGHGHHAVGHVAPHDAAEAHRSWLTFALMIAAQIMVIIDVSVTNVALPSISRGLHLSSSQYQWTVSAYVLLSGGLLLLGGRIADLFDRRRAFLSGVGLFTVASIASGLATTPLMLIVARAAQGAGAALATPSALSIVMTTYAGAQRQKALAIWGAIGSGGLAIGVLAGGTLTSALGWRAVFFINAPIGVAVFLGTLRNVAHGERAPHAFRRMDARGALTLVTGLLSLVYGIEQTRTDGWASAATLVPIGAAIVLLASFALLERRAANPLVPPATWRIRSLVSASTVMAVVTGVAVGTFFLSSLYLQQVTGASAIVAGCEFLPIAFAITASAVVASKLIAHVGAKSLIAGGLVITTGGLLLLASAAGSTSYVSDILPAFVVIGLGLGPMFVAISIAAMSGVDPERSGLASGLMMTGHEVGAALGVAALTAVAGDITTRAGLVAGFGDAFHVAAIVLGALFVLTLVTVPGGKPATGGGHGGHGGRGH